MEIQVHIRGGGGIQCRRSFAIDVVPVQLTIYSLSRLSEKYLTYIHQVTLCDSAGACWLWFTASRFRSRED